MFSLIITVIAISLVAALSLAGIYYGGDTFQSSNDLSKATKIVNESQQIAGAITISQGAGDGVPSTLDELVENEYLSDIPGGKDQWEYDMATLSHDTESDEICKQVNVLTGYAASLEEPVPTCTEMADDFAENGRTVEYYCCDDDA